MRHVALSLAMFVLSAGLAYSLHPSRHTREAEPSANYVHVPLRYNKAVSDALFNSPSQLRTSLEPQGRMGVMTGIAGFLILVKIVKVALISMAMSEGGGAANVLDQIVQAATGIRETGENIINAGQEVLQTGEDIYQAVQGLIEAGEEIANAGQGVFDTGNQVVQQATNMLGSGLDIAQVIQSTIPSLLPALAAEPPQASNTIQTSKTAVARIISGAKGELYFAQSGSPREIDETPKTIVSGIIEGLSPGKHSLRIHRSGVVTDGCSLVGEEFSKVNGASFVVTEEGRAVLLLQESDIPLSGSSTIIGRSILISAEKGTSDPVCAAIALS